MTNESEPLPVMKGEQDIVIVDDTPDNLRLLVGILKESGYKVRPAPNGKRALATIHKEPPDLILLDIMMPEMDGYEVCERLKKDERTRHIPIIFLSALNQVFDKIKAFSAGGVDYITKPFQVEEVLARVNTHLMIRAQQKALTLQNEELMRKTALIEEQARKLERLASRDFLTGLSNRRDFMEKAHQEEKRIRRTQTCFALILIDIDHFKKVNDTYGHDVGDNVLVSVAQCLQQGLRAQDIVARWGGEEFICLLPETELGGARHVGEKLRTMIESRCQTCDGNRVSVTATLGISLFDGSCSIDACIGRADVALYEGKKRGRNQVQVAG